MKKFIGLVALMSLTTVFALDKDSSWEKIGNTMDVGYDMYRYYVGGNTWTEATNVCLDGDNVRTKTKRDFCLKWESPDTEEGDWKCVDMGKKYLTHPVNYTYKVCNKYVSEEGMNNCLDWSTYDTTLPLNFKVKVWKTYETGEETVFDKTWGPLFVKDLNVPNC